VWCWLLLIAPSIFGNSLAAQGPDPAHRDDQRLAIYTVTLMGDLGGVDAATRTAAATELLRMEHTKADAVLALAMRSARGQVMRAVFVALAQETPAPETLVDIAIEVLPTAPAECREALALLLARTATHAPAIIEHLRAMSLDPQLEAPHRIAAIAALGEFRHTPVQAAASLMHLLEQAHIQSQDIVAATTTSLGALTGLPPNEDVDIWIDWWAANRDRPAERWLADMVQALSRRVTALEHRNADETTRTAAMTARLIKVHDDLWPLLSIEAQAKRLPLLLSDDLMDLRAFGLRRAAVLLRDSNATDDVHNGVLQCLQDDSPRIRLDAATLLPELPPEDVEQAVSRRLQDETDVAVANALLLFCETRPDLQVPPEIIARYLAHAKTCTKAGDALWHRLDDRPSPATTTLLLEAIAAAHLANPDADLRHLSAALGDETAADQLVQLLDAELPAVRMRTAEALRRAGKLEPILARAGDSAIFPIVVRAVGTSADLRAFDALAALQPPDEHVAMWQEALLKAATATTAADRIHVDDVLGTIDGIDAVARIDLLVMAVAPEQAVDLRLAATDRLVPLLTSTGEDRAIMSLVNSLPAQQRPASLDDAAFVAALRAKQFDAAAALRNDPRPWVQAFEAMQTGRPELADMVRTEIVRRFNEGLSETLRGRLGMAADPLMGDASESPEAG
jgi:hypothetical protein